VPKALQVAQFPLFLRVMPVISFTSHLRNVGPDEPKRYCGRTLREVLDAVAQDFPRLPGYLFDDQGQLRKHLAIFVDGSMQSRDQALSCPLTDESEVHIFQALSGG